MPASIQPGRSAQICTAVRRPLLVSVVIGSSISLMDAGTVTLRLALPSAFWWSFLPVLEIVALFAASPAARRAGAWPLTIDRFFRGHGPSLLWLVVLAACCAYIPTPTLYAWPARDRVFLWAGCVAIVWSAALDFRFFHGGLKQNVWRAARDLLLQRCIAWSVGVTLFVGAAAYQTIATRLGL
ncbi:MAG TPA: hypothetical protein VG456_25530 [Candidatus Sulfopaludibacter sp.]|jgi:hypothetical protein|nr:hypothetical protein [Candidatus Sulfopaludibacter sp.]